jgi:hypothetical protein
MEAFYGFSSVGWLALPFRRDAHQSPAKSLLFQRAVLNYLSQNGILAHAGKDVLSVGLARGESPFKPPGQV